MAASAAVQKQLEQQILNNWHTKSVEQVADELNTSISAGLTEAEVIVRQSIYGFNELSGDESATWVKVLWNQLKDVMNWIFIALGVICSAAFKDYITGSLLVVVAIVNLYLSFQ